MNHLENSPLVASPRKPYMKPSVKMVPLRPDEAVLGGCKKSGQGGPIQADCTSPGACSSTSLS
jgi:hypothetical protein